jgi:GNAT superfamily N-acetyltransferase
MVRPAFPTWFDAAAFRDAFQLDTCGLPLVVVRYVVKPDPESDSVDVFQEYVDDESVYRVESYRRIRDIGSTKIAEHVAFYVLDDPAHATERFQRRGLATSHLRKILPLYDGLGVTMIRVAAARDGRTVWPRFGFQIDSAERRDFENQLIARELAHTGFRPGRAALPISGPDILAYTRDGHALGVAALESRDIWTMQLDLTDSKQRAILEAKCRP